MTKVHDRPSRCDFLRTGAALGAAAVTEATPGFGWSKPPAVAKRESLVAALHQSLNEKQPGELCFDWNHQDPKRGLLRTRVGANWKITEPENHSDCFTADQQEMIQAIFEGVVQPEWRNRFDQQLEDDIRGVGHGQAIAISGQPGKVRFVFVLTGRT